MIRKSAALLAVAILALGARGVQAQDAAPKVDGTYVFTQSIMTSPDAAPIDAQAKLVVTVKGDSAFATWQIDIPGREARPTPLKGTVKGNVLTLVSPTSQAQLRGGVEDRSIDVHQEFILTVSGDVIKGTINNYSNDDTVTLPSRELSGKRG